ncbi:hypothetical protein [Paenibacillus sp. FSL H7-0331]|nr:hypothetical protein [Paenibacillus sp. FSL H7-0331]
MHDVMLISPGGLGHFGEGKDRYYVSNVEKGIVDQIANFHSGPISGDVVLLRKGKRVIAIGKIPDPPNDEYQWDESFGDVLGWDSDIVAEFNGRKVLFPS